MIQECTRNCLCVDCANDNCWHHGDKVADCPRWGQCDLKRNGTILDCDECHWIDGYIAKMRGMNLTIELPWEVGSKLWLVELSSACVPTIYKVDVEKYYIYSDSKIVVLKTADLRYLPRTVSDSMPLFRTKAEAKEAVKDFYDERGTNRWTI